MPKSRMTPIQKAAFGWQRGKQPRAARLSSRVVLAALIGFSPFSAYANQAVVDQMIKTCSDAASISDESLSSLLQNGWNSSVGLSEPFKTLMVDGITASMATDRSTPIDWATSRKQAEQLTTSFAKAAENDDTIRLYIYDHERQAALIVTREPNTENGIRCIYGGFVDQKVSSFLNTMSKMDKQTGLRQASPGLDLFDVDEIGFSNGKNTMLAIRYGVYVPVDLPSTVPAPQAALGISLIRITTE